jgi:uncharacterized protein (TIGR00255 family)
MTGFAGKTEILKLSKGEQVSLFIELKTINSRFFEVAAKLPSALNSLEIKITNKLKDKLLRGRVFLSVRILENDGALLRVTPSIKLLEEYLSALSDIKKRFKISGDLTISDVLNLPNIFSSQPVEFDTKAQNAVLKIVDDVIEELLKSRLVEGNQLRKDLDKRFDICGKKILVIKKRFDAFVKEKKDEMKTILVVHQKTGDEESKLKLDEIYSLLNKIDVHEEIVRFESHLKNAKKIIKDSDVEKGKRLDFVLQELLRESNTILAKCSDFEMSTLSVDIKVELEKVREQAQNIV